MLTSVTVIIECISWLINVNDKFGNILGVNCETILILLTSSEEHTKHVATYITVIYRLKKIYSANSSFWFHIRKLSTIFVFSVVLNMEIQI